MKSRVKHNFALFILLMVGYTQVYAAVYGQGDSDDSQRYHVQIPYLKAADIESVETEEEFKRNFFKEPVRDNADFIYGHQVQQFIQHLKNQSSFNGYSSCISLFASVDCTFDVLRL